MTPEVEDYLSEVTRRLQAHLGRGLLGAWMLGSATLGDFDPARSDLDVQVVSESHLARPELERLAAVLSHPTLECPARGLELVLYARDGLTDPRGPAFELNLNTGPGIAQHAGYDPGAEPRFWFVLDVSIAGQSARPLAGAPPTDLLPRLPRDLVLAALRESFAWYRAHDGAQAILAACRGWAWATDGRWLSKADAAAWAADRLPDRAPIEAALTARAGGAGWGPPPGAVASVIDRVESELG